MRLAIATTVKDCKPYLDIFLRHHFSIGFDHIFLFLDDPSGETVNPGVNYSRITIIKNDKDLQMQWEKLRSYRRFGKFAETECMARQILNVDVALKMAVELKIDWLLHIDIDELFYSPEQDVKEYFQSLTANKIESVRFQNHEAIPAKADATDVFTETTLFKKNFNVLNDRQKKVLLRSLGDHCPYFNYYGNGKSAAKVTRTVRCSGVHEFNLGLLNKLNFFNGRKKVRHQLLFPCILHYACCNFDTFWNKYQVLGNFKDKWFDRTAIKDSVPMHISARDACMTKDLAYARSFYETVFIETPSSNSVNFLKEGIYFKVQLSTTFQQQYII